MNSTKAHPLCRRWNSGARRRQPPQWYSCSLPRTILHYPYQKSFPSVVDDLPSGLMTLALTTATAGLCLWKLSRIRYRRSFWAGGVSTSSSRRRSFGYSPLFFFRCLERLQHSCLATGRLNTGRRRKHSSSWHDSAFGKLRLTRLWRWTRQARWLSLLAVIL